MGVEAVNRDTYFTLIKQKVITIILINLIHFPYPPYC